MTEIGALILLWNPTKYAWESLSDDVERVAKGKKLTLNWTTGARKTAPIGTLVFFRRVRKSPTGIIGYGITNSAIRKGRQYPGRFNSEAQHRVKR